MEKTTKYKWRECKEQVKKFKINWLYIGVCNKIMKTNDKTCIKFVGPYRKSQPSNNFLIYFFFLFFIVLFMHLKKKKNYLIISYDFIIFKWFLIFCRFIILFSENITKISILALFIILSFQHGRTYGMDVQWVSLSSFLLHIFIWISFGFHF